MTIKPTPDELNEALLEACNARDVALALALLRDGACLHAEVPLRGFPERREASPLSAIAGAFFEPRDLEALFFASPSIPVAAMTQAFLEAMRKGMAANASFFLKHGADPAAKDSEGSGALRLSIDANSKSCCELALLHCGANLNKTRVHDDLGITALSLAAERRAPALVDILLPYFDIGSMDFHQRSELILSAIWGKMPHLIDQAWPIGMSAHQAASGNVMTCLAYASAPELVERIIGEDLSSFHVISSPDSPNDLADIGFNPLMLVVFDCDNQPHPVSRLVEALLPVSDPKCVDEFGRDALMVALDSAACDACFMLKMISWADLSRVDVFGETALDKAIASGHLATAEALVLAGASLGLGPHPPRGPISNAAQKILDWMPLNSKKLSPATAPVILRWLRLGANPHQINPCLPASTMKDSDVFHGGGIFFMAVDAGDAAMIDEAMRLNPGHSRMAGLAAQRSVLTGQLDCLKSLLRGGVDPAFVNEDGRSLLMSAVLCADSAIVDFLWPRSDFLLRDAQGFSFLDLALKSGKIRPSTLFDKVAAGSIFAALDSAGWRSLAISSASSDLLPHLLDALREADLISSFARAASLMDAAGRNALSLAAAKGLADPVARLLGCGCVGALDILGRDLLMVSLDYGPANNGAALFLAQSADLSLRDSSGASALDKAARREHWEVFSAIKSLVERRDLDELTAGLAPAESSAEIRKRAL